jgi:putative transcriptional regulator
MSVRHPTDDLLMQYASGALPQGLALFVATHLNYCAECRDEVRTAELIGGALLASDDGGELTAQRLNGHAVDILIDRAAASPSAAAAQVPGRVDVPVPLRDYIGPSFGALKWRTLWPGVQTFSLRGLTDEGQVNLIRLRPGMAMPDHTHAGDEHTLVLQGAFEDETGRYSVGDVAIADESLRHRPMADSTGPCLCLYVVDAPLRFTSKLTDLVSRLLLR